MKILLSSPHMSDEGYEKQFVKEAFDSNWVAPLGANVTGFEEDMQSFLGEGYTVALSAGTAAIHLGLKLLGVGVGDVVFCQSFTFSASCNPVTYLGAKPVFIDSEYTSGNMSPKALEKAYEKYPNPKAVVVVDLYGTPANYNEIIPIVKRHGTPLLEDAAEALGSKYNGKRLGLFGDVGALSFNGNKIITTSGGGMLVVKSKEQKEKVVFWSTQSREKFPWYQHNEIGYNYRLSNVSAGIGRGQMKVLPDRIAKKRLIYDTYSKVFSDCKHISMFGEQEGGEPNRWLSVISLKNTDITPIDVMKMLSDNEIESRPAWKPMHLQPVFADCDYIKAGDEDVCKKLFECSLCLPSDTKTDLKDIERVANLVKDFVEKNS